MSLIIPYDDKLGRGDGAFISPNNEIIQTRGEHERFSANYCGGRFTTLTKEQLELYKLWLDKNGVNLRKRHSDFMVFILGFDKIETIMRRAITTTSDSPHIKYYNYYLMEWYIDKKTPMRYNEKTGLFVYDEPKDWVIKYNEDRKVEAEINEIKQKVLIRDRHYFFK